MRRFFILTLLLASVVTLRAASYETRSPQHSVTIDVVALTGIDVRYDIKITDLVTGEVLASPQLSAKRGLMPVERQIDVRDLHIRIRVGEMGIRLMARVEFEKGGDILDSIQTYWSTGLQKAVTTDYGGAVRVGGDVKAPIVINRVEPVYSDEARKARISGVVIVEVMIGRDGLVKKADVLKPLPFGLDQAAIDAVKQWIFKPGTLDGQAVDVIFDLTVNFRLDKPAPPPPG